MSQSRYVATIRRTRREVLRGSVVASLGLVVAACRAKSTPHSSAANAPSSSAPGSSGGLATSVPGTSTDPGPSTTPAATGPSFDIAQQLKVALTYVPAENQRVKNPYVAVWIEDAQGMLVRTIGISIQTGRGLQYVQHLKRWFRNDAKRVDAGGEDNVETISSPTRTPGAYDFVWDGRDSLGQLVAEGSYKLLIETAREHGPYSVLEMPLTLDGKTFTATAADSGEIQRVTIELVAA